MSSVFTPPSSGLALASACIGPALSLGPSCSCLLSRYNSQVAIDRL
jgi:hypothetical protein